MESQYKIKYFDKEKEINKIIIKLTLPTTSYTILFDFDK